MVDILNQGFNFLIGLGGAALTFIFITIISLFMGVKFSKAVEGGLRMGIALTGMGAIISLLTNEFGDSLSAFVERTGTSLDIVDLGWAQMAVITWGSAYTMLFALICLLLNLLMLYFKKTNTMNVDLFNVWHLSIIGMLTIYYTNNIFIALVFVIGIYAMMLINSDLMKPQLNQLLGYSETNVTATAHPAFLFNPMVMFIDNLITKIFPSIDKYDFNAEQLNEKIGFWGSNFAVGIYLGIFIGILGQEPIAKIITMSFTAAVCLELFGVIGGWFGPAMEPISEGIVQRMKNSNSDRKFIIGVDWAITAVRPEIWAVANILAPILMVIAMFLPGNKTLPLGGIILTALVPSLLFVTKGKVMRMTIIGTICIPLYLWASTLIADFMTQTSINLNVFPDGLAEGSLFTSIEAIPLEKIITVLFGETFKNPTIQGVLVVALLLVIHIGLFIWYRNRMIVLNKTEVD
ncbi:MULTISPECIES: PTS transporter subunit IIC [Aerococcus]|uniref:PTS galactitol transporter subunit IIC n=1 Tax=Aerococcus tenax TaxID=3078812 RepID=A0A5N1BL61_9LACT|nr:PTS transporter subunit IIC [Aerococcus urinae]KAA9240406.1 PTS galactitol transporter subunit IIC [Aerococcus urinae]MDK7302728.1 PTS transporter subunit IIC [Aerococcus urinae]MDK7801488.1 PTS transporter subunit IIC [Aerococcus urinae]MDK8654972.1 PTS transporter subunit IIC [Aerococcus urinae]RAV70767.1 PTS galactitol transporter subunit IIC [Aerococcus urinae]